MSRKLRAWLCVGCGLMAIAGPAWAAERGGTLTTAQLLVDLARDHGLQVRGHQTPADVQQVRALLQAAVRLDPTLAEAYVWLYELAMLEGDETEAAHALTGLLNAQPTHQGAFARWLAAGARTQQTMEERVAWLAAVAATMRPPALEAMTHTALGRLALEQTDAAEARRQATLARELEPASGSMRRCSRWMYWIRTPPLPSDCGPCCTLCN